MLIASGDAAIVVLSRMHFQICLPSVPSGFEQTRSTANQGPVGILEHAKLISGLQRAEPMEIRFGNLRHGMFLVSTA